MKAFILLLFAFITGCSTTLPPTSEFVFMRDVTEQQIAHPDARIIIPFMATNSQWEGTSFSYVNISDVSFNPVMQASIGAADQLQSNEFEREDAVKQFTQEVRNIIDAGRNDTIGRKHSSVYIPLAQNLNRLSHSNAARRVLVIYSDLMENELTLSFYDKKTFPLLQSNPESVKKILFAKQPLERLDGIEVYLICQPVDAQSDLQYQAVSNFYKSLLEEQGATVIIGANLIF